MKRKKPYTLKPRIKATGYPVHTPSGKVSSRWKKAHKNANKAALKRFGGKTAKEVSDLVKRTPKGELLGSHTKGGKILISKRVPKKLRGAVAYHEKVEHRLMSS